MKVSGEIYRTIGVIASEVTDEKRKRVITERVKVPIQLQPFEGEENVGVVHDKH